MSDPTPTGRSGGWFADRPIGVKIGAAVALLAVVAIAMTVLAVMRLNSVHAAATRINDNVVTLADLATIQRSYQGDRARYNQYGLADAATRTELRADLVERRQALEEQLDAYAEVTVNKKAFAAFRDTSRTTTPSRTGSCCPRPMRATWPAPGGSSAAHCRTPPTSSWTSTRRCRTVVWPPARPTPTRPRRSPSPRF